MKNLFILLLCIGVVYHFTTEHPEMFEVESKEEIISNSTQRDNTINIIESFCHDSYNYGYRTEPKDFIVWHTTNNYNEREKGDGLFHTLYQDTTSRKVSWHFTIDDTGIYQHHDLDIACVHSGLREYNIRSIGIEICTFRGIDIQKRNGNISKLYAYLSKIYPEAKHLTHAEVSGKTYCPEPQTKQFLKKLFKINRKE